MLCLVPSGDFGVSLMHTCIIDNCISLFHVHIVRINALGSVITRCYRGEGIFNGFLLVLLFL